MAQSMLYEGAFSRDSTRFAYSTYDAKANRLTLFMNVYDGAHLSAAMVVADNVGDGSLPGTNRNTFAWSPDGQWLAYWSRAKDGSVWLNLADRAGQTRQSQQVAVSASGRGVILLGWSVDGRTLAVDASDDMADPNHYTLSFWSAPDLKLIHTAANDRTFISQGASLNYGDSTIAWSADGHQLAYLSGNLTKMLQLGIIAPGDSQAMLIALPGTAPSPDKSLLPSTIYWSPGGRFVTVSHQIDGGKIELDLINAASGQVQPLSTDANLRASVFWSANGRIVYYVQRTPDIHADLMAFHPDDNRTETLASAIVPDSAQEFFDGLVLFQQMQNDVQNFVLLRTASDQISLITAPYSADLLLDRQVLAVSASGKRMVFADYVHTQGGSLTDLYTRVWSSDDAGHTQALFKGSDQLYRTLQSLLNSPISPDGHWLALSSKLLNQNNQGLLLIALDSAEQHPIKSNVPNLDLTAAVSWSSDGSQLLVSGTRLDPQNNSTTPIFAVLDIPSGTVRRVIEASSAQFGYFTSCP